METAASPEEKASARPPSRAPSASSNADHVGFAYRPYSRSPPATYVDAIVIGAFSGWSTSRGGRPACTTTVAGERAGVSPDMPQPRRLG